MSRIFTSILVVALAILFAPSVQAATVLFDIYLDGLQETPPNASPGTGYGTLSLNDSTGDYSLSGNFSALFGTTNSAQLRGPAAFGASGPLISLITYDIGVTDGTFSHAGTFDAGQMAELLDEKYYVKIATSVIPGGEIRGQIVLAAVPEPASLALLAAGGLALVVLACRRNVRPQNA